MTDHEKAVREILASCQRCQKLKIKYYGREPQNVLFLGLEQSETEAWFRLHAEGDYIGDFPWLISQIESVEKVG